MAKQQKIVMTTCPVCAGRGTVEDYSTGTITGGAGGETWAPTTKPCAECNGSGEVKADDVED
jgi:RecJ-like exonuclease